MYFRSLKDPWCYFMHYRLWLCLIQKLAGVTMILPHVDTHKSFHSNINVRGLFKKFCYERLSIRKDNACLTDFMHKYSSFFHICTCEISKESSKYQYSYWHLKWPQSYTLAYIWRWKGESVELGDANLHKKSCCDEKFAPKKEWRTNVWE